MASQVSDLKPEYCQVEREEGESSSQQVSTQTVGQAGDCLSEYPPCVNRHRVETVAYQLHIGEMRNGVGLNGNTAGPSDEMRFPPNRPETFTNVGILSCDPMPHRAIAANLPAGSASRGN